MLVKFTDGTTWVRLQTLARTKIQMDFGRREGKCIFHKHDNDMQSSTDSENAPKISQHRRAVRDKKTSGLEMFHF